MPILYLVLSVSLSLSVSFLCSILEAALLSASEFDLSQRAHQGNTGAIRLLEIKRKRIDEAISAILTYNTIAHTVGATLSGYFAAEVFGDNMVGIFSGVLTILILIVTEIIPKTLGTVHALRLAGFVSRTIQVMMLPPMSWLLVVLRMITRLIASSDASHHRPMTRRDILAVVQGAIRDKSLDDDESRALIHLLRLSDVTVSDVMTPRTVAFMLEDELTLSEVIQKREAQVYSRIPVYSDVRDLVRGYVLTRDVIWALAEGSYGPDTAIKEFVRPVVIFDEELPVAEALNRFRDEREHLAIVADEHGGTAGLITMEDVVETALGFEIVDEVDRHVDLREEAIRLRNQRLTRLEQQRKALLAEYEERRANPAGEKGEDEEQEEGAS